MCIYWGASCVFQKYWHGNRICKDTETNITENRIYENFSWWYASWLSLKLPAGTIRISHKYLFKHWLWYAPPRKMLPPDLKIIYSNFWITGFVSFKCSHITNIDRVKSSSPTRYCFSHDDYVEIVIYVVFIFHAFLPRNLFVKRHTFNQTYD